MAPLPDRQNKRDKQDGQDGQLDARMRTSLRAVAASGAALTLFGASLFGLTEGLSVGLGACLAIGNLWGLAKIVVALLPADEAGAQSGKGAWGLLAALKMFGLIAAAWLLMRHGIVSPLPMLIGFGALPIGIAIGSLVSDRNAPPDDD